MVGTKCPICNIGLIAPPSDTCVNHHLLMVAILKYMYGEELYNLLYGD